jgi:hypothetical protein
MDGQLLSGDRLAITAVYYIGDCIYISKYFTFNYECLCHYCDVSRPFVSKA